MGRSPFPTPASPPTSMAPGVMPPAAPGGAMRPMPGRPQGRDPVERRTLVVGKGISVQGTVQDAERLVVEGTVEASMIHATELSISQGGVFRGEVEVEDAEVSGTIDGTLTARGNLIVRSTGRVLGTARCRRLVVEDGGQITGRIEMLTEAPRAPDLVA
jgi:cytoskeletal protein CcmA (bactofilin family)